MRISNCKIENNILKANLDRICLFLLFALVLQARNLSVIIDTDAGSDDLIAIAFLLSRTDVHVEAINVVSGVAHVPRGAENIRKLLAFGRREDWPRCLLASPVRKDPRFGHNKAIWVVAHSSPGLCGEGAHVWKGAFEKHLGKVNETFRGLLTLTSASRNRSPSNCCCLCSIQLR